MLPSVRHRARDSSGQDGRGKRAEEIRGRLSATSTEPFGPLDSYWDLHLQMLMILRMVLICHIYIVQVIAVQCASSRYIDQYMTAMYEILLRRQSSTHTI